MKRNQYSKGTVIVTTIIVFLFIYSVITLLWIGAEYIFEGAIVTSKVDTVIAGIMTYYFTHDIFKNIKQEDNGNGKD